MDETIKLVWGAGGMIIDYANKSFPIYGINNDYMTPFKSLVIDKSEAWKIYQIMREIIDGKHDDGLHIFASDIQLPFN